MKTLVKRYVPGAAYSWRALYRFYRWCYSQNVAKVFSDKYQENGWGSQESRSGAGSELRQTEGIRRALPQLFRKYEIGSVLDLPCGDLNWIRHIDYDFQSYIGGDIVPSLVERNREMHGTFGTFVTLNLVSDKLPRADLLLCRDCLVHLSYRDIGKALQNIRKSGIRYLLATQFPSVSDNRDILTGGWRPLNLQAAPFLLPPPLELIVENSTEPDPASRDKCLALWEVSRF